MNMTMNLAPFEFTIDLTQSSGRDFLRALHLEDKGQDVVTVKVPENRYLFLRSLEGLKSFLRFHNVSHHWTESRVIVGSSVFYFNNRGFLV